jgi:probable HAF family extracellular repeat protein
MFNVTFHGSSRGKMPLLSKLNFKGFFGKRSALFLSCLVLALITQALPQSAEAQIKCRYTVTRLVPISGVHSYPQALNAQGDVVGYYYWRGDGTQHVFLNHAGIMHDIPALAGSFPTGINIYGRIVGVYSQADLAGYTYFEKKVWPLFRTIPGVRPLALAPAALNTAGHIVCSSNAGALVWQKSGITFLPAPQSFNPSAINNNDQVVGAAYNLQNERHAFLLSGASTIDLGTLQNLPGTFSAAYAVNDQGQIAGYSTVGGGARHAFIYSGVNSGGKMQDIQTIDPGNTEAFSFGYGINNSGQVVGQFYYTQLPQSHASIYDGLKMIYLQTLIDPAAGWLLGSAWAINDAGQIIATGSYQSEEYEEACLLTPVR